MSCDLHLDHVRTIRGPVSFQCSVKHCVMYMKLHTPTPEAQNCVGVLACALDFAART